MKHDPISLHRLVERDHDRLIMRIPLDDGGERLNLVASGISVIEGGDLVLILPPWLTAKLEITEGSDVWVDDRDGSLHITKAIAA